MGDTGEQLVRALVDGRFEDAEALLDADVDFVGLVPSRTREGAGREATMEILRRWFDPADRPALVSVGAGDPVLDRRHVRYRLRNVMDGTEHLFEQQAYYDVSETGRITWMRVVCSGQLPVPR